MVPKVLLGFLLFGAVALAAVSFPTGQQCTDLCTMYLEGQYNCSSSYNIYASQQACEAECARFPITTTCADAGAAAGCQEAATENSYDCRLYHLGVATDPATSPANHDFHCPHSTPLSCKAEDGDYNGGQCLDAPATAEDTPKAGTIQDLCNNLVKTCGSYFGNAALTMQYCYNAMYYIPGYTDLTGYPTEGNQFANPFAAPAGAGADNFICRRYHVDVAGTSAAAADTHCQHAFTGADQCGSNCDFYCDLVQNVCGGALEQYATTADCLAACDAFDTVSFAGALPTVGNTLNCRIYHATVAAQNSDNAAVHCPHTGVMSTPDTCGTGFSVSASLFLVAVLAFFSLN